MRKSHFQVLLDILVTVDIKEFSITVTIDGIDYQVYGRVKMVIPKDIHSIELLKPGSQPKSREKIDGVEDKIIQAVERLVKEGEPFATPLRREWREPHLVWQLMPGTHFEPRSS
jgi:hypothetical protein